MLTFPRENRRSVNAHNIDRPTFLDWLETTSIFTGEDFSRPTLVDYLLDQSWYSDQDFAWEFVQEMWDALQTRLSWLGAYSPISIDDGFVTFRWNGLGWKEVPAHSFCLVVSFGPKYSGWTTRFGTNYNEQGQLFELVTKAAMESRFDKWQFVHTGWGSDHVEKLSDVVESIIDATGERGGNLEYASDDANDAGVDLVWHLPFADGRGGGPTYLAQCASGGNWQDKLKEPDIDEWAKIVDFAARPHGAFSIPFALTQRELRRNSNRLGNRLLLDRYRLLGQGVSETQWVPQDLRNRLVQWLEPRIEWIMAR